MSKTKKKTSKKTNIALVIDRSGSMSSVWKAALDGLNETINELKKNSTLGGDTSLSIIAFDSEVNLLVESAPAEVLPEFNDTDIFPRGTTALYDAVKTAIETIGNTEETEDTGYFVTVISDGHENASHRTNQEEVSKMIKELEETGKWTFNFMLSNQDIHQFVKTMGVSAGNVASYTSSFVGTTDAFAQQRGATLSYLSARNKGVTSVTTSYQS
jgi:uncharacterized protein YegL